MEKRVKISNTKKMKLRAKYNNRCCFCGEHSSELTVEHLIPLAVAKWTNNSMLIFEDDRNLAVACHSCNQSKTASVLPLSEYLKVDLIDKEAFTEFYNENIELIEQYKEILNTAYSDNKGECHICKQKVGEHFNLRRRDDSFPRSLDNVCLMCSEDCNSRWSSINRRKRKRAIKALAKANTRILAANGGTAV